MSSGKDDLGVEVPLGDFCEQGVGAILKGNGDCIIDGFTSLSFIFIYLHMYIKRFS